MRKSFLTLLFLLSTTGIQPAPAMESQLPPLELKPADFSNLIGIISTNPTRPYKGRMVVSRWAEKISESEELNIYFFPPDRYRLEFLNSDGSLDRVILSTDRNEELRLYEKGQLANSYTSQTASKRMDQQKAKELILKNYTLVAKDTKTALGRPAWIIELTPVTAGKPMQQIWVDKKTNVILQAKRFFPDSTSGSLIRFTTFEVGMPMEESLFLPASEVAHELGSENDMPFPQQPSLLGGAGEIQGGFLLESIDKFEVEGKEVKHLRFTDGLLPLSIFETPVPVDIPSDGISKNSFQNPLDLTSPAAEHVYAWERDKTYYTLIGDMQQNLFKQIATNLK